MKDISRKPWWWGFCVYTSNLDSRSNWYLYSRLGRNYLAVSLCLDYLCISQNFFSKFTVQKETLGQNTTIEFYVSFNLVNGYIRPIFGLPTGWRNYGASYRNYTGWKFDKTTRFEFCTDSFGNNVASCTVKSLATEYQYSAVIFRSIYEFFGGVNRKQKFYEICL